MFRGSIIFDWISQLSKYGGTLSWNFLYPPFEYPPCPMESKSGPTCPNEEGPNGEGAKGG